jgi:kynurenine formamidase
MANDFRAVGRKLSNWARWGAEDQRGTLNHIGAEQVLAAVACVRLGQVFDLGIEFGPEGPQDGRARKNPQRVMLQTGLEERVNRVGAFRYADDMVVMELQAATQWDALAHVHYDGVMYNGHDANRIDATGSDVLGVEHMLPGVVGRGILIDVARHQGVDWLDAGHVITPTDFDQTLQAQGTTTLPGDIVLIRTGWRRKFLHDRDQAAWKAGEPGVGLAAAEWCHQRNLAAIGADNFAIEAVPCEDPLEPMPFHMVALRDMGMPIAEMLDLENLADACSEDRRYEFLFVGSPLRFMGAMGSPTNPVAIR